MPDHGKPIVRADERVSRAHDLKAARNPCLQNTPYAFFIDKTLRMHFSQPEPEDAYAWELILDRIKQLRPTFNIGVRRWSAQDILKMLGAKSSLPDLPPHTPITQSRAARLMGIKKQNFRNTVVLYDWLKVGMWRGHPHVSSTQMENLQKGVITEPKFLDNPECIELSCLNRKHEEPKCLTRK